MPTPASPPVAPTPKIIVAAFALTFAALSWLLRRPAIDWDGMAFLLRARDDNLRDFAHLLYPSALRGAAAIGSILGQTADEAARGFSIVAGAFLFAGLWSFLERRGVVPIAAAVSAVIVSTTPALWRETLGVEVYAPSLALLVIAANAAATSGPSAWRRLAAAVALFGAASMHVFAFLATPWLVLLAGEGRFSTGVKRLGPAILGVGVVVLGLGVLLAGWTTGDVREFLTYSRGFAARPDGVPGLGEASVGSLLWAHLRTAAQFLFEAAPLAASAAVVGAILVFLPAFRGRRSTLWFLLAYVAAFVVLGVPILGLLLPAIVAGGILFADGLAALAVRRAPAARALTLVAAVLLVVQIAGGIVDRRAEAGRGDPLRDEAHLLAAPLPPNALLFTGRAALHLRYYTPARVVALPERLHRLRASGSVGDALMTAVLDEAAAAVDAGRLPLIDTTGGESLSRFGVSDAAIHAAVDADDHWVVRPEPHLAIYRFQAYR